MRIQLQKLKGEVVDRARAIGLVFRGIGAHAMQTVLETHVRQHLGELAEVRPELR